MAKYLRQGLPTVQSGCGKAKLELASPRSRGILAQFTSWHSQRTVQGLHHHLSTMKYDCGMAKQKLTSPPPTGIPTRLFPRHSQWMTWDLLRHLMIVQ